MFTRLVFATAFVAVAGSVHALDLWNQESNIGTNFGGVVDQEFVDFPTFATYSVDDVVVGAPGWHVSSIQTMVIAADTVHIADITQARLNVFAGGAASPSAGSDPSTGTLVNVTVTPNTNFTNVFYITATGLNLNWAAGEYWVGLSALATYGDGVTSNNEVFIADNLTNSAGALHTSFARNPANGWQGGSGWQDYATFSAGNASNGYGAMDIQGTLAPEPVSLLVMGMGGLALLRRRKK